ncbi:hypothetical protein [Streptomyces sp. NPDC048338]
MTFKQEVRQVRLTPAGRDRLLLVGAFVARAAAESLSLDRPYFL